MQKYSHFKKTNAPVFAKAGILCSIVAIFAA